MGKLIRRVIAILLCVTGVLLLLIPATPAQASFTKGDFIYDGDVLQKYTGQEPDVTIPLGVTQIGKDAFSNNNNLRSVYIPSGIDKIGFGAFENCKNLESVVMEDDVKIIDQSAFSGCQNLSSVNLPRYVEEIGSGAFAACPSLSNIDVDPANRNFICLDGVLYTKDGNKLVQYLAGRPYSTFDIPEPVTELGEFSFYGANMLTDVNIVNGVKEIPDYTFLNCNGLSNVFIPTSVEAIRRGAFGGCPNLTSIGIPAQVRYIDPQAFTSLSGITSDVVDANSGAVLSVSNENTTSNQSTGNDNSVNKTNVDNSSVPIDQNVYIDPNVQIQGDNLPDTTTAVVTQQSQYGGNTDNLADIIKNQVVMPQEREIARTNVIGGNAVFLMDPSALKVYSFDINQAQFEDSIADSGNQTMTDGLTVRDFSGNEFDVINGVLGHYGGNGGQVLIPENVYKVGNRVFYKNNNASDIVVPNSTVEIGDFAFARSNANSISLPDGLEKIGYAAFYNASNLHSLNIPSSVKEIELGALEGSGFYNDWLNIEDGNDFLFAGDNILIGYKGLTKNVTIPNGVKTIGPGVFQGNNRIETVEFPETVEKICEDAFNGCENLTEVSLPTHLTEIEDRAFKDTGLKDVSIPASVQRVGLGAFDTVRKNGGINSVTFEGLNLPSVSYKPTASRLSAKDLRTCAFEGAEYAMINTETDINGSNLFDAHDYGFRGCVLSRIADSEEGLKQVELRKALVNPNQYGNVEVKSTMTLAGTPYNLAGVRESAFKEYENTDWCNLPVNNITVLGNNSSALLDLVENTTIGNQAQTQSQMNISVDPTLNISPTQIQAQIPNNNSSFNLYVASDPSAESGFVQAFNNRYGRSDNLTMSSLSIDMMDKMNKIPIHKMASDKMEMSIPVPANIAAANDIKVATLDDNGMLEDVPAETVSLNDGKYVRFVASHLSPFCIYYFRDSMLNQGELMNFDGNDAYYGDFSDEVTEEFNVVNENEAFGSPYQSNAVVKTLNKSVSNGIKTKTIVAIMLFIIAIVLFVIPIKIPVKNKED